MKWHEFIGEQRKKTGLTQEKFAAMIGIPASTLRAWEAENWGYEPRNYADLIRIGVEKKVDIHLKAK